MSLLESQWPAGTAVLRWCRRCAAYRSIDQFSPLGKLCRGCVTCFNTRPAARLGLSRALVITDKGRATLAEMRKVAA